MAITITAAAVLSMFASLTLVPMLPGCFSTRGTADAQGGEYSDRNWFESDRATSAASTVAEQARKILLATVGWSLVPDESSAD